MRPLTVRRRVRVALTGAFLLLVGFLATGDNSSEESRWIDQLVVEQQAGVRLDVTSPYLAAAWPGSYLGLGIGTDLHLFGSDLTIHAFPGDVVVQQRGTHFFRIETTGSEQGEVRDINEARGICYVITAYVDDAEYLTWKDVIYASRDAGDNWAIELEWGRSAALANLLDFGVGTGYRVYRRFVALTELGYTCQTCYSDLELIEEFPSAPAESRIIFRDQGRYGSNPEGRPAIGPPGQVFDKDPLGNLSVGLNLGVGIAAPAGGPGNAAVAGRVGIGGAPDGVARLNITDPLGADIRLDATPLPNSTSLAGRIWTIRSTQTGSFTITDDAFPGTFCAGGDPRLEINRDGKVGLGVSPVLGPAGSLEVAHSLGVGRAVPGDASCGDIFAAGMLTADTATIELDLTVGGNLEIWNDLLVMNDVDILNNLFVAGDADVFGLNVENDLAVGGKVDVKGNLDVTGNLNVTGVKFFVQEHPTDLTKEIAYAALEGPEAGTYVRGTARLVDGEAAIELPESFALVTAEEGLTVQVTLLEACNGLYVAEKGTERIVVRELLDGTSNARFDYLVQGVRKGYEGYDPIRQATDQGGD